MSSDCDNSYPTRTRHSSLSPAAAAAAAAGYEFDSSSKEPESPSSFSMSPTNAIPTQATLDRKSKLTWRQLQTQRLEAIQKEIIREDMRKNQLKLEITRLVKEKDSLARLMNDHHCVRNSVPPARPPSGDPGQMDHSENQELSSSELIQKLRSELDENFNEIPPKTSLYQTTPRERTTLPSGYAHPVADSSERVRSSSQFPMDCSHTSYPVFPQSSCTSFPDESSNHTFPTTTMISNTPHYINSSLTSRSAIHSTTSYTDSLRSDPMPYLNTGADRRLRSDTISSEKRPGQQQQQQPQDRSGTRQPYHGLTACSETALYLPIGAYSRK